MSLFGCVLPKAQFGPDPGVMRPVESNSFRGKWEVMGEGPRAAGARSVPHTEYGHPSEQ